VILLERKLALPGTEIRSRQKVRGFKAKVHEADRASG
jgi:hypothetical protein